MKYLGVTISNDLTWSRHINNITKSTKCLLWRIHRKFHDAPNHLCLKVYQTTVLPKLDYCCAVWDPHQVTYRSQLENIQKFTGRIITKNWSLDYPSLCVSLNLKSLYARRQIQKLKLCYKILTSNSCLPSDHFTPHPHPSPWCPNSKQLLIPYARTSAHKASYFIDTAKLWNTLPEDIISAPSLDSFKNRLGRFYTSIS